MDIEGIKKRLEERMNSAQKKAENSDLRHLAREAKKQSKSYSSKDLSYQQPGWTPDADSYGKLPEPNSEFLFPDSERPANYFLMLSDQNRKLGDFERACRNLDKALSYSTRENYSNSRHYLRAIQKRAIRTANQIAKKGADEDLMFGEYAIALAERVQQKIDSYDKVKSLSSFAGLGTPHGRIALIGGILGILLSLFFSSISLTGSAISMLPSSSSQVLGLICFILGLIGVTSYFRQKEK